nr:phosphatase PAP2 family protein [uncultured Cohaesibacter sp.]
MRKTLVNEACRHPVYWASMAILLLSALFLILPELDLWTSQLFFSDTGGFWLKAYYMPVRLRKLGLFLPRAAILLLLGFALARLFWSSLKKLFPLPTVLFLGASALLGPGLLVNGLLKTNWGRARPIQTDLFGGAWPFSEVWVITDHCQSNCSFVSGEASMGFWLLGLVLLLPIGWRKASGWLLATLCCLISLNRIAFGGHFLSDILLSWALTGWVMLILYRLMEQAGWFGQRSQQIEEKWDAAGHLLRARFAALWRILRQ